MRMLNRRVIYRDIVSAIEDAIAGAYDLGHAHGMCPSNMAMGLPCRRSDEGWYQFVDQLFPVIVAWKEHENG